MTTLIQGSRAAPGRRVRAQAGLARLVAIWNDLVVRWKARREARAQDRLDRYWTWHRSARERYLSRARDPFELERLERQWERHHDFWRDR
jgi:hypothetical protein